MKDTLGDTPWTPPEPRRAFDGKTYQPSRDYARLNGQLARVHGALKDGHWWTIRSLAQAVGGTEAAVSARIRDLRKPKFGGHTVERRFVGNGLFEYRLITTGSGNAGR